MDNSQKTIFTRALHKQREEALRNAKSEIRISLSGEIRQTFGSGLDECDMAAFHELENIRSRRFDAGRETIRNIDQALERINEGVYGVCEDCGEDIGENRLRVIPFARYCRDCQDTHEARKGKRN